MINVERNITCQYHLDINDGDIELIESVINKCKKASNIENNVVNQQDSNHNL